MRIRELTLNNYRGFQSVPPFRFADGVTVIAGVNGRGKTTILNALALVLSRLLPQISVRSDYIRFYESDITFNQDHASVAVSANCAGIPVPNFKVSLTRGRSRTRVTRLPGALRTEIRNRYGPDPTRANDAAPLAVYYTTDRAGYPRVKALPESLPEQGQGSAYLAYFRALTNRVINYRDLLYYLKYIQPAAAEGDQGLRRSATGERAFNSITRCLGELLAGFENPRMELNPLRFMIDKNGQAIDVAHLSDGERAFFAIIADLCRRLVLANPELEDPLTGEGVVLIDEIELHLHPRWQTEVIGKLRRLFPRIQFITTTHSPYVIRTLERNELIRLDEIFDESLGGEFTNRGLEEVSAKVMKVDSTEMTPRYREMLDTAKEYFRQLEAADTLVPAAQAELKQKLDALSSPFADNPAYQAFLEMRRVREFRE